MPDVRVVALVAGKSHFSNCHHPSWAVDLLDRRSQVESDVENEISTGQGLSITGLQPVTVRISAGRDQTGDSGRRRRQSACDVAQGSINGDNCGLRGFRLGKSGEDRQDSADKGGAVPDPSRQVANLLRIIIILLSIQAFATPGSPPPQVNQRP